MTSAGEWKVIRERDLAARVVELESGRRQGPSNRAVIYRDDSGRWCTDHTDERGWLWSHVRTFETEDEAWADAIEREQWIRDIVRIERKQSEGPVDAVRQSALQQEIVQGVLDAMDDVDGWIMLNCFFTQAGGYAGAEINWFRPDLSKGSEPVPATVMHGFVTLRDAMWNPQSRPWLSVHVQGNSAGTFSFSFNYERRFDLEARYKNAFELTADPVPTDADLIADLARFPRSAEMLPAWYPRPEEERNT